VRRATDELRASLGDAEADPPADEDAALAWIEARALALADRHARPSLRRVINATGVILHTNLGRAPLAAAALDHARVAAAGYVNLEYDLDRGARGHRHTHAERRLCMLTGAEAALVVNNNAAAALLALAALASGREVIVSRGELVEIGGGFRVPDVLAQSGAALREVGTTNRTRAADYAAAIGDRTAAILRVHPSNFRIDGFTERPALIELAALADRFQIPLIEDLGSGWLDRDAAVPALADEPNVTDSLRDGAHLVMFSGDKLLGGPQAGLVVGRRDLVDRLRAHPLMRALRADKLTHAALEATLILWASPTSRADIPVYRMLTMTATVIEARARRAADRLGGIPGIQARLSPGESTTGGGAAPALALPTTLLTLTLDGHSTAAFEQALRMGTPPIVARIQQDAVVVDLRTVAEDEDDLLTAGITDAARRC
jgi:L-seryl-tRNA(Ser) seleniumtransferase